MNQIEQNIEKIKETQGILSTQPVGEELDPDARMKINDDLVYLNDLTQANKNELASLKSKIKRSFKSAEFERNLARITKARSKSKA